MVRARLYEYLEDGSVKCLVCERLCRIPINRVGVCRNYANIDGDLHHIGYGVLSAVESRPIEIKPLFHYWPNSTALTFSGYGCNFYCPWCQNHHLSFAKPPGNPRITSPSKLIKMALKAGDEGLCASFNEPITLYDYLIDLFHEAKRHNLYSTLVTNGYFTENAVKALLEAGADGFSIDVKGCPKAKSAIASIDHEKIFRNARTILDYGGHVEIVYLVVTGYNDFEECVEWIVGKHLDYLGPEVPLHVNRYYPAHVWRMPPTSLSRLAEIREKALRMGLKYVYVGNVGNPELEATKCPKCGKTLIYRIGYRVAYYGVDDGRCPRCGESIPIRGKYVDKKRSLPWL